MFDLNFQELKWINEPRIYRLFKDKIEIATNPKTDFWQRTYYNFRNDNAHVLYQSTDEKFFSFSVKTEFNSNALFDQCGIAIYQDCENWMKAGIEFHDKNSSWLGSVVTNNGYSDWATVEIESAKNYIWYRLSRRESDYLLENSFDGIKYRQMRIFHLIKGGETINFGFIACSPSDNSFTATFSEIKVTDCLWKEHVE